MGMGGALSRGRQHWRHSAAARMEMATSLFFCLCCTLAVEERGHVPAVVYTCHPRLSSSFTHTALASLPTSWLLLFLESERHSNMYGTNGRIKALYSPCVDPTTAQHKKLSAPHTQPQKGHNCPRSWHSLSVPKPLVHTGAE